MTTNHPPDARRIAAHLSAHGSKTRAAGIQWFFKEAVRSHGWRTADLRRYARDVHAEWSSNREGLLRTAGELFRSDMLEEKLMAVLIAQRALRHFGRAEFRYFERWLPMVASWADHDALAMFLLGPLMTADRSRVARVFVWARSARRWHRRAAAVSLIDGVRRGHFRAEATAITYQLMTDEDDMVRKGLGWLLREWGKVRPFETSPLLMDIRTTTSRLVLRTACERLPAADRLRILARS